MAEETMVKDALTEKMIESGVELIKTLDKCKLIIRAVYWLYITDLNSWQLILVSDEVKTVGPKKIYKKVQAYIAQNTINIPLDLNDISVVGPNDFITSILRVAIRTGKDAIMGIRFSRNTINGIFINDAYIYRIS